MTTILRLISTIFLAFIVLTTFGQTVLKSKQDSIDRIHLQEYRQIFWDSLPKPTGWVNDFEGLYSSEEEKALDSIIGMFQVRTSIQIAVVTIDTSFISRDKFDDLTLHIANILGVGQKGKDNGVLIGISCNYRKMRIQNGYGIEKLITNEETKTIIDNYFIPDFRAGEFFQGTLNGLTKLMELLNTKLK